MGLFKKRSSDPTELERIKTEIATIAARLERHDVDKQELGTRVDQLKSKVETPPPPPPAPTPPPPPEVTANDLHIVRAQIQRVSDRIEQLDGRVTSISTELANQLSELASDMAALEAARQATPPPPPPPTPEPVLVTQQLDETMVDELRDSQTQLAADLRDAQAKLAAEQARYQIAFRQELAELVEFLRRES
jgi:DNA repair exonuclease SbcCD ATPase subunit